MKYDWKLLKYPDDSVAIKEFLDLVISNSPNLPANNRWQFIFPILDLFFSEKWCVFAALEIDSRAICALPIVTSEQSKFLINWTEIGFPKHSHINFIEIGIEDVETALKDLATIISKENDQWHRLCFRNVHSSKLAEREYTGDCAWFSTDQGKSINEVVSKKHVRNTRRLKNRLIDRFDEPQLIVSNEDRLIDLEDFVRVEECSWKGKQGVAISSDENLMQLYSDIATSFSKTEFVIFKLIVNKKVISTALGFHLGNTLYLHKVSFDPEYAEYAPGNILLLELITKAIIDPGISSINLINKPAWSKRWHPNTARLGNFTFYNHKVTSSLLRLIIAYWRQSKKWAKKLKINNLRDSLVR